MCIAQVVLLLRSLTNVPLVVSSVDSMWRHVLRFVTGHHRTAYGLMGMPASAITREDARRFLMPYTGEEKSWFLQALY